MPRKKLTEFRAKTLLYKELDLDYVGWKVDLNKDVQSKLDSIDSQAYSSFVVKVDQGVKGRFKKGLIKIDVKKQDLEPAIKEIASKGTHSNFIIEPYVAHKHTQERYLALTRGREGVTLSYSDQGGIDIESNTSKLVTLIIEDNTELSALAPKLGIEQKQLASILSFFDSQYLTLLEINPYLAQDSELKLLDLAIEVDDAANYFVDTWSEADLISYRAKTPQEETVDELAQNSPSSFKLEVINPDGSIFLLLSGGGASIVVADLIYTLGYGKELANYGEYSGNPNESETYIYTKAVVELLLQSKSRKKIVFIGGAVANFTDIANTFAGIISVIEEFSGELKSQNVKFYVRRGGPRQEIGLKKIESALQKHGLLGFVSGPDVSLAESVNRAVKGFDSV
jgi:ATP-citrate lyase beta-subunit